MAGCPEVSNIAAPTGGKERREGGLGWGNESAVRFRPGSSACLDGEPPPPCLGDGQAHGPIVPAPRLLSLPQLHLEGWLALVSHVPGSTPRLRTQVQPAPCWRELVAAQSRRGPTPATQGPRTQAFRLPLSSTGQPFRQVNRSSPIPAPFPFFTACWAQRLQYASSSGPWGAWCGVQTGKGRVCQGLGLLSCRGDKN